MLPQFKNLKEMMQRFSDDKVCREYLEQQRWNGNPTCPHCGHVGAYTLKDGKTYKCKNKECFKKYTVTVGTVFENSNIPLNTWFYAVYVATAHKKGISSLQLSRDLSITQKSAWFMLHRIREAFKVNAPEMLEETVEIDETYMGGMDKNKHNKQRKALREGTGYINKTPVVAMLERDGSVITASFADRTSVTGEELKPLIRKTIAPKASIITDGYGGYIGLDKEYASHEVVNHTQGEYVRGIFHTNSVEGFFSQLKRGIYGIYHQVSPKHLQTYCTEFAYRYNTRKVTDNARFVFTMQNITGRLRYQDLIKK